MRNAWGPPVSDGVAPYEALSFFVFAFFFLFRHNFIVAFDHHGIDFPSSQSDRG
jgi:hypothetical protein